jgi:hypothetical protein
MIQEGWDFDIPTKLGIPLDVTWKTRNSSCLPLPTMIYDSEAIDKDWSFVTIQSTKDEMTKLCKIATEQFLESFENFKEFTFLVNTTSKRENFTMI